MNCSREKIIMAFYNEVSDEEREKVMAHINECKSCMNFYNSLSYINKNIVTAEKVREKIEDDIISYANRNIKNVKRYFSNLVYSFSLSVAVIVLFVVPEKKFDNFTEFENKIYSLESSVNDLAYDIKFIEDDLNNF